jgi:hypothetical protein
MRKLCGIGVYDSLKPVKGNTVYYKWADMIKRSYDEKFQSKNTSYTGCEVSESWLLFSNFDFWCQQRVYSGLDLDKDIIKLGNKTYSEDFCAFVPRYVNLICVTRSNLKGDYPLGVVYYDNGYRLKKPYQAQGSGGAKRYLGYFSAPEDAHKAWQLNKIEVIQSVISRYKLEESFDNRVQLGLEFRIALLQDDINHGRITETL